MMCCVIRDDDAVQVKQTLHVEALIDIASCSLLRAFYLGQICFFRL